MNNPKVKLFLYFVIGALSAFLVMYFVNNYTIEKKDSATSVASSSHESKENTERENRNSESPVKSSEPRTKSSIDQLTDERTVINYVKQNHRLPDCYITKNQARNQGWIASQGNLCDVLPGRAIGGDHFSNREKTLPKGEQYYEADVNYRCGRRNADRIIFTKNGDVWLTKNHYKSFEKQ